MQDVVLKVEPARLPDWEARDLLAADLEEDTALFVLVRTSDRSDPVEWDVMGEETNHGITWYSVWRAPKHLGLCIDANVRGEVRATRLFAKRPKARFYGGTVSYLVAEATS